MSTHAPRLSVLAGLVVVLGAACDYQPSAPPNASADTDVVATAPDAADTHVGDTSIAPPEGCVEVAGAVKSFFATYCGDCHAPGGFGARASGLKAILDVPGTIAAGLVKPGDAAASAVWERVAAESMPPAASATKPDDPQAEAEVVRRWIDECDALDFDDPAPRPFVPMSDVVAWVAADLDSLSPDARKTARYLMLTHLDNAGLTARDDTSGRVAVSTLVNSLSWSPDITVPVGLASAHPDDPAFPAEADSILRVDLRDYRWQAGALVCGEARAVDAWELLVGCSAYPVPARGEAIDHVREVTGTRQPIVMADWFVFVAARPPLYHDMLGLPADTDGLEGRCLGFADYDRLVADTATGAAPGVVRSGFDASGVSRHNRLVERADTAFGAYWKSYDFQSSTDHGSLKTYPLGPSGLDGLDGLGVPGLSDGDLFVHAGGEQIFHLPDGLLGFGLTTAAGVRLDEAPTTIVTNHVAAVEGESPIIADGIGTCQWCHAGGLIDKADELAPLAALDSFAPAAVNDAVGRLHPPAADFSAAIARDNTRYLAAATTAGEGRKPVGGGVDPMLRLGRAFDADLGAARAAAELGLSESDFMTRIATLTAERDGDVHALVQPFRAGQSVKRVVWTQRFRDLACALDVIDCASKPCGVAARCSAGSFVSLGEGEPCVEGRSADVCVDGLCIAEPGGELCPNDCAIFDGPCRKGVCTDTGCQLAAVAGPCDDLDPGTSDDTCSDGQCSGTPVDTCVDDKDCTPFCAGLSQADDDCGTCGHACTFAGSFCASGLCAPVTLARVAVATHVGQGERSAPTGGLATTLAETRLWVATNDSVWTVAKDGSGVGLLSADEHQPQQIVVAPDAIVWMNKGGGASAAGQLRRMPMPPTGPVVSDEVIASTIGECGSGLVGRGVVINGSDLVWLCDDGLTLQPLAGTGSAETLGKDEQSPYGAVSAGDSVWFATRPSSGTAETTEGQPIRRWSRTLGSIGDFVLGQDGPELSLVASDGFLYWSAAESDEAKVAAGVIARVPVGAPLQREVLATFAGNERPGRVAVDHGVLYYVSLPDQRIHAMRSSGGGAGDGDVVVAVPAGPVLALMVDDEAIYWSEHSTTTSEIIVRKVARLPAATFVPSDER